MAAPTAFSRILGDGCTITVGTGDVTATPTAAGGTADLVNNDDIIGGSLESAVETLVTAVANGENHAEHASTQEQVTINVNRMCTAGFPLANKVGELVFVTIKDDATNIIIRTAALVENATVSEFEKGAVVGESVTFRGHLTPTTVIPAT